ncbi:uncharacterized protein LOC110707288 [Chenopodium quinoa]|uniref:uncharacterized protein LOC110707288 n=1 Tax=Chenopodium quinoa TaxID=63459 RepID=UPI000B77AE1F|nr:uncharacterized protein LOC110707288 [Chenopodium quinoa]
MSNTDNSSVPMDDESEVGNENATTKSTKVGDKRKSEYWNHFWDFRDPVTKKIVQVKCKYCEKMLTGNLCFLVGCCLFALLSAVCCLSPLLRWLLTCCWSCCWLMVCSAAAC